MINVSLEKISPNPHRDFEVNPLSKKKVTSLKASVKKTHAWENMELRVKGNEYNGMTGDDLAAYLLENKHSEPPEDMEFEIPCGHHRLEAFKQLKIDCLDFPVKVFNSDQMLQIMAEENKDSWAEGGILVIIETVRQIRALLDDQIAPYKSFKAYKNGVSDPFFTDKETFEQAKAQGIGYRTCREYLGKNWNEGDVRGSYATIGLVDAGVISLDDVRDFPSVNLLVKFSAIARGIRGMKDVPEAIQNSLIVRCAKPCSNATVKVAARCGRMLKDGDLIDPVRFLQKLGKKAYPLEYAREIKRMIVDEEMSEQDVKDVLEGLKDLDEYMAKALKSIKNDQTRKEKLATGSDEEQQEASDFNPDEDADLAELDAAVADADAEETFEPTLEAGADNIDAAVFTTTIGQANADISLLTGRMSEVDSDENLTKNLGDMFDTVSGLMVETYGKAAVTKRLKAIK